MILYHTSEQEIRVPDIHCGRKNADFGWGFYLTPDRDFTYRWARENAVVNEYELDVNAKPESEHSHFDSHAREVELLEERIEQEAISFCRKYKDKKEYIALCQVAFVTNPTRVHHREMYNEFCELTTSTSCSPVIEGTYFEEI